ncbi:HD-GYP domain-containing protein [Tumebacillus permanentifrigoris]|uniref:Putative nucleotidyltransferase with HDIG domain n=1 Tax=Tumebacillus permanentifrigoris TaxID=378543 RepID=A0A316DFG3_9BACL|nr:HD-GYP domain-containing protein [Tumebacillus permanentifrigoris]PWK16328.1 putative nucleotidyltransferase with HDIG domain [Tumebacillus permanentifrigoris]
MRLAALEKQTPGVRLARPILDEKGLILVGTGVELTAFLQKRLIAMGITSVYIEDERTDDIVVEDVISQQTRQEALQLVHTSIQTFTEPAKLPRQFQQQQIGRKIRDMFDMILSEMKSKPNATFHLSNIYSTDNFLYHHSVNVSIIAMAIGMEMGLTQKQLLDLGVGTLLHDVGKLSLPQEILNKPGRLTPEEFSVIKQHPMLGYEILRQQDDISLLSSHVALQHHEKIDGTGYPRGLKGDEIHIYARITAVADVYEALTANRVYRKGALPHLALELLLGSCGTHFQTDIVQKFLKTIAIYPIGMTVVLSSGEEGVVTAVQSNHPQRPTVRVLRNASGEDICNPYELNLMDHLTTMIVGCEQ